MSHTLSLKEMERKVFRSHFADGLWEIYLGLLSLNMGLPFLFFRLYEDAPMWQIAAPLLLVIALSYALFWAGKKYIVLPRVGRVNFGAKGRERRRNTSLVFAGSVLVGLLVFVIGLMSAGGYGLAGLPPDVIIAVIWVINVVVVFGLAAHFLAYERFYLIGILFALPFPTLIGVDRLLGIDLGFVAWVIPSCVILLIGLVTFVQFLRNNPRISDREAEVTE